MLTDKFLSAEKISNNDHADSLYANDSSNNDQYGLCKMFVYGCIIVIIINAAIWTYFLQHR